MSQGLFSLKSALCQRSRGQDEHRPLVFQARKLASLLPIGTDMLMSCPLLLPVSIPITRYPKRDFTA